MIPYRSGNLFGLSDEKGKEIIAPQYDYVGWMEGSWFRTPPKIALKDTLETARVNFSSATAQKDHRAYSQW